MRRNSDLGLPQDDFFSSGGSGGRSSAAAYVNASQCQSSQSVAVSGSGSVSGSTGQGSSAQNTPSSLLVGGVSGCGGMSGGLGVLPLSRQISVTSEIGWERDLSVLMCDCIDPESFIAVVRASSGASADLTASFLDRYVFDSGG